MYLGLRTAKHFQPEKRMGSCTLRILIVIYINIIVLENDFCHLSTQIQIKSGNSDSVALQAMCLCRY